MPYFESGKFDAVAMVYTLHHISRPDTALLEVKRVLSAKGTLVVADYVIDNNGRKTDCHKFSFRNMKKLFQRAGFNLVENTILEPDLAFFIARK
jgi:ubiquinone/menaquinone biosynthesis C-methylase UbiE